MLVIIENKIKELAQRDRRALLGIVTIFLAFTIYLVLITPFKHSYDRSRLEYLEQLDLLDWLKVNRSRLVTLSDESKASEGKDNLLSQISKSAETAEIELSRLEPSGRSVLIAIDKVKFSRMLAWLSKISIENKINVTEITVTRVGVDLASARIRLE